MLHIGLLLLVIAAALLILAVRGRVVARGVFCRRCRFDLTGLDRSASEAACPECGRSVSDPRIIRSVLRRRSRLGIAGAMVLLLVGATLTGIAATNNTARILATLPDGVLLALHRLGIDAAFVEIADNRLARVPPLSERAWSILLDESLDHFDTADGPQDARHGEVIAQALLHDRMDETQLRRFMNSAIEVEAALRDKVPRGESVPMRLRISAPTIVVSDQARQSLGRSFYLNFKIVDQGRVHPQHARRAGGGGGTGLYLPNRVQTPGFGGLLSAIQLPSNMWDGVAGDDVVQVFADIQLSLRRGLDGVEWPLDPVRIEHEVTVVPANATVVRIHNDAQEAIAVAEIANAGRMRIRLSDLDQNVGRIPLSVFLDVGLPGSYPLAGRLYIGDGGDETEFAAIAMVNQSATMWTSSVTPDQKPEFRALFERCIEQGFADVIFRSDPEVAYRFPELTSILGVDLLFSGVRVYKEGDPAADEDRSQVAAVRIPPAPSETNDSAIQRTTEP